MAADEVSLEFRICNWLGPLPPSSQDRTLGLGHLAGRTSPPPPAPDRPNTKYTNTRVHKYTIHKYTGVRSPGQTSSPAPQRPITQIHKYTNTQIRKYTNTLGLGHLAGQTSTPPLATNRPNTKYTHSNTTRLILEFFLIKI